MHGLAGARALKGGLALETRLGEHARVSIELDADHAYDVDAARVDLQRAAVEDLGDHFDFAIAGGKKLREAGVGLAVRYKLESSIAGRPFEPLQVDVSISVPDPWDAQPARRPGLLTALGLDPLEVLLVPLERQVAEKLHALTRTHTDGSTTRGRDLVGLMLVLQNERVDAVLLKEVIGACSTDALRTPPPIDCRPLRANLRSAIGGKQNASAL